MRSLRKVRSGVAIACVTAGALAMAAALIGHRPPVPPAAPRRVTIATDPVPGVAELPPPIAQLVCSNGDDACAGEGADAVAAIKGAISVPTVDTAALIARCGRSAEAATVDRRGVAAFEGCLRAGRPRSVWLPGAGFRLPKAGWLAFYQRDDAGCADRPGRCTLHGLVDLADGTAAITRTTEPAAGGRSRPRVERFIGTAPVSTVRETALIAVLAPHVALPQVAITADVPAELIAAEAAPTTGAPVPDRFVQMTVNKKRDNRWVWLSATGEVLATSSFQAAPLSGSLAGRLERLPELIRGGCPKRAPPPDADKIDDALVGASDGAFVALRTALAGCSAGHR